MNQPANPEESADRARKLDQKHSHSGFSPFLVGAYRFRFCRPVIRKIIERFEGGAMHSSTLRIILQKYFSVEVGLYSYGPCLKPGVLPPGTKVGCYCSFAEGIKIFRRNHPKDRLSTHPFFYNRHVGIFASDTIGQIADNPLSIGHDVWIGDGAVILPNCRKIGNGAIIGAAAVVTKDVPDFGIVVGNPGKLIGHRFSPELSLEISKSAWWDRSIGELATSLDVFSRSLNSEAIAALVKNLSETPQLMEKKRLS